MGTGSSSDVRGTSQPLPLQSDLCLQRSTKTLPSMQLSGSVASTIARRSAGRSFASPSILTRIRPVYRPFILDGAHGVDDPSHLVPTIAQDKTKTCHPCSGSATTDLCLAGYPGIVAPFIVLLCIANVR